MKVSDLIDKLRTIKDEKGDLEVYYIDHEHEDKRKIEDVFVFNILNEEYVELG